MKLKDPLSGHREVLNEGRISTLFLKPHGKEALCPVEVGQFFVLKSCGVEVTRKEKIRRDGEWVWKVDLLRIRKASKPRLLKRGGGYTHDPDLAMRSHDDVQAAATIDAVAPDERSEAHKAAGEPLEGEPEDDVEIWHSERSRQARERYALLQHQIRAEERLEPLASRVLRLERTAGVDLTRHLNRIEQAVTAGERKMRLLEPEKASDKIA